MRWVDLKDDFIPQISQYSTGPRVELRLQFDEAGTLEIRAFEDRTVCSKVVRPRKYGGYVTFKPGTAEPLGYAGRYGHCLKERALPSGEGSFRCGFTEDAKVELHGYAWPSEVEGPAHSGDLSRRRVEFIWDRLESRALPNTIIRAKAHGTDMTSFDHDRVADVPGAYFRIIDTGDPRTVPAPAYQRMTGPPLTEDTVEALRKAATESTKPGFEEMTEPPSSLVKTANQDAKRDWDEFVPWMSIDFAPPIVANGKMTQVRKEAMTRGAYESQPLVRWGRAMLAWHCKDRGARWALP